MMDASLATASRSRVARSQSGLASMIAVRSFATNRSRKDSSDTPIALAVPALALRIT
ncbi:hypothetical protein D3C71_1828180 [compost metagenome]